MTEFQKAIASDGLERNATKLATKEESFPGRLMSDEWVLRARGARDVRKSGAAAALPRLIGLLDQGHFRRRDVTEKAISLFLKAIGSLLLSLLIFTARAVAGFLVCIAAGVPFALAEKSGALTEIQYEFVIVCLFFVYVLGVAIFFARSWHPMFTYLRMRSLNEQRTTAIFTVSLGVLVSLSLWSFSTLDHLLSPIITFENAIWDLLLCFLLYSIGAYACFITVKAYDGVLESDGVSAVWRQLFARHAFVAVSKITESLKGEALRHICPTCIIRITLCDDQKTNLQYFHCRQCGKVYDGKRELKDVEWIVMVLKHGWQEPLQRRGGTLYVNYFFRRAGSATPDAEGPKHGLTDMDRVEIHDAPDTEVERFVMDLQNDDDDIRREQYGRAACVVAKKNRLSAHTMSLLRNTFGEVTLA